MAKQFESAKTKKEGTNDLSNIHSVVSQDTEKKRTSSKKNKAEIIKRRDTKLEEFSIFKVKNIEYTIVKIDEGLDKVILNSKNLNSKKESKLGSDDRGNTLENDTKKSTLGIELSIAEAEALFDSANKYTTGKTTKEIGLTKAQRNKTEKKMDQEELQQMALFELLFTQFRETNANPFVRAQLQQVGTAILISREWMEGTVNKWPLEKIIDYVRRNIKPIDEKDMLGLQLISNKLIKRWEKYTSTLSDKERERIQKRMPFQFNLGDRIYDSLWGSINEITDPNPPNTFLEREKGDLKPEELNDFNALGEEQTQLLSKYEKQQQKLNLLKEKTTNGENAVEIAALEKEVESLYEEIGQVDDEMIGLLTGKKDWLNDLRTKTVTVRRSNYDKMGPEEITVGYLTNVIKYRQGYTLPNLKQERGNKQNKIGKNIEIPRTMIAGRFIKPGDTIQDPLVIAAINSMVNAVSERYTVVEINEDKNSAILVLALPENLDKTFSIAQGKIVAKMIGTETKRLKESPITIADQEYKAGETITEDYQRTVLERFFKTKDEFKVKRVFFDVQSHEDVIEFVSTSTDKNKVHRISKNKYDQLLANFIDGVLKNRYRPENEKAFNAIKINNASYISLIEEVRQRAQKRREAAKKIIEIGK